MFRGRRITALAAATTIAVGAAACGGDPVALTSDAEARQAVLDTFRGSWRADTTVEIELTEAQRQTIVDAAEDAAPAESTGTLPDVGAYLDLMVEQAGSSRSLAARGEDGSRQFASVVDDATMFDVRLHAQGLLDEAVDAPELTVQLQVDIPAFLEQFQQGMAAALPESERDALLGEMQAQMPDLEQLRGQARMFLSDGPLEDMVLAVLDGQMGALTGALDPATLGGSPDDLQQMRDEWPTDLPDAELFGDAITIRDLVAEDGGTTAVVDLHPRAFIEAMDAFAVASGMPTQDGGSPDADEVPETVPDVARLTFDGAGRLSRVVVPFLDVVRGVADQVDDVPAEMVDVLDQLDGARYDMVLELSDHGAVDTVLDEDATTATWEDVAEVVGTVMGTSLAS